MSALQRRLLAFWFLVCAFAGLSFGAFAQEPRTALVIGNAEYSFGPLANSVNDAVAIAKALDKAGFKVILQTDATRDRMEEAIHSFGETLKAEGGVGMFYYAGHGVQIGGENYLLPVGPEIDDTNALKSVSIPVSEAVAAMTSAHDGLNIVVLDACRTNPLSGTTKGLSRLDSDARLFVSYSTSPGSVASDGEGENSPYTKYLANAIETPSLSLEETFKRTLKGVYQETGGRQTPWISSSFFGDFTFVENGQAGSGTPAPRPVMTASSIGAALAKSVARAGPGREISGVYRVSGTNPNGSVYDGMMTITPQDNQVRFTWWVGEDVFTGVGEFAGRMLVVEWGSQKPVVYTFNGDARLDGEWADGSATEVLTLFSKAAVSQTDLAEGSYRVSGANPNGTTYTGTVNISREGGQYVLDWTVGADSYRGFGELEGNVLTVEWGDITPVVYALMEDGSLNGLWAAGRGSERLERAN